MSLRSTEFNRKVLYQGAHWGRNPSNGNSFKSGSCFSGLAIGGINNQSFPPTTDSPAFVLKLVLEFPSLLANT